MNDDELRTLEARAMAGDKLVKALITLLSEREPHLLEELGEVFMLAAVEDNEVAQGAAATWAEVRHEMEVLRSLRRAGGNSPGGEGAAPR